MKHRFAICSDTHGNAPPPFVDTHVDAILHAGDIYHSPDLRNPAKNLHALQEWIKSINIPIFAVRGNHDFTDPANFFANLGDLTGHVKRAAPHILIAGLGLAYPSCADLPTNYNLLDATARILMEARRLQTPADHLILLTHYPVPAQSKPNSPHAYPAIAQLLAELESTVGLIPIAIIEGHIHEWFNTTDLHQTPTRSIPIYRPGPAGAILQIDDETWQMKYDPY